MPKGVYDRKTILQRIHESIIISETTGCWLWNKRLDKDGYGQISVGDSINGHKTKHVHKVAYEQIKGPIEKGLVCSHLCDEKYPNDSKEYRRCCNPEHIEITTAANNSKRMCELGRYKLTSGAFTSEMSKGENNIKAKLTEQQVIEILTRHKAGLKYGELKKMAEEYDIKYITIQKIVAGKLWIETYNKFNS